jgi:hypothetical protein
MPSFRDTNVERIKSDLLVLPVREKKWMIPALRALDRRLKGHLRGRIEQSKFTGAEGATLLMATLGMLPAAQILLIGVGAADMTAISGAKLAARGAQGAAAIGAGEIAILFAPDNDPDNAAGALVEGALLASYHSTNTARPHERRRN